MASSISSAGRPQTAAPSLGDTEPFKTRDAHGMVTTPMRGFGPKGFTSVAAVCCGTGHCLAVTTEGQPYVWGSDAVGQLGLGEDQGERLVTTPRFVEAFRGHIVERVWAGGDASFALTSEPSALFSWGGNLYGQLGQGHDHTAMKAPHSVVGMDASKLTEMNVGFTHAMAVVAGTVWAWGRGGNGQLGGPPVPKRNRPWLVVALDAASHSATFSQVACGNSHSAAVTSDGRVLTWGALKAKTL